MPMTECFVLFNYFLEVQSFHLRFAKHRPFVAKTPRFAESQSKQSRDCMQQIHAIAIARIVTRALRTSWHLDGSHGVRDGRR